jgi:hypothetical protein
MAPQPADGMPTDFRHHLADMIEANETQPAVLLDLAAKLKAGADPLAAMMDTTGPDRVNPER